MKPLKAPTPRQASGRMAEDRALAYLQQRGLKLVERNFRCKGGEIDLVLAEPVSGLLVFVEVRQRNSRRYGGAAASVTRSKQAKLIIAAEVFLQRYAQPPACRFDVVAIDDDVIEWIRQAFET
ncbi:YraN family protein [Collimonas sp. OK412]|jgi:putative endonuclease|uniref:YraN family protein n=1 Tax=Collimonas sp. (strain OK412) TaxID=1801619 RepID=UPI0008E3386B|nr:YraN family protein [Collimonas sp. OK412]SFC19986.1 putative endonuclease [Collimonas sp. OK412]